MEEINQRILCSKKLNKYVAGFDYIDKILTVSSATAWWVSICKFTSIVSVPVGIVSASFTLTFSIPTGITKKIFNITKKRKKKRKIMIKFWC